MTARSGPILRIAAASSRRATSVWRNSSRRAWERTRARIVSSEWAPSLRVVAISGELAIGTIVTRVTCDAGAFDKMRRVRVGGVLCWRGIGRRWFDEPAHGCQNVEFCKCSGGPPLNVCQKNTAGRMGWLVGIAAASVIFVTVGCRNMGSTSSASGGQSPAAQPRQHPLLENIPLPMGFRLVPDRSVARSSGQTRVAQCEFEGDADPDAVTKFYLHYMPSANFALRQRRFDNGEYTLRFESDTEECNVRVRPGKMRTTILIIDIGPVPKGPAERKAEPALRRS